MTITILQGDCVEVMRTMDAESVDCVVTSPPYWGLRDYGVEGQMGLEQSLGEHLEAMVNVFAETHRILKPTGTVWLNYGDCYATTPNGRKAADIENDSRAFRDKPFSTIGGVLKAKDLCMIPNRLAIALQEWGWWVRSEIIWAKPNPMPESIKDRPATSHEKIFLLTKSPKYFYDADSVKEPVSESTVKRLSQDIEGQKGSTRANGGKKTNGTMKAVGQRNRTANSRGTKKTPPIDSAGVGHKDWCQYMNKDDEITHRNLRNVWHIGTKPFSEAHFATFPPELAETCIKAGCPKDGVVFDPFGGAGTTGLVADQLQRDAILIELNPEYIEIAERRLKNDAPLFCEVNTC